MRPVLRQGEHGTEAFAKTSANTKRIQDAPLAMPIAPPSGKFPMQGESMKHAGTQESSVNQVTTDTSMAKEGSNKTSIASIIAAAAVLVLIWVLIFLNMNNMWPFAQEKTQAIVPLSEQVDEILNDDAWTSGEDWNAEASEEEGVVEEAWITDDTVEEEVVALGEVDEMPSFTPGGTTSSFVFVETLGNQFYMIAASHPDRPTAEKDARTKLEQSASVFVIAPREGREENFRVAVGRFASLDEATNALESFRNQFGESVWVLRY
jgi:hypothetical protein